MHHSFNLLLVDDSLNDAESVVRNLNRAGLEPVVKQVWEWQDLKDALEGSSWDFILCDHRLPTFDSSNVLSLIRELGLTEVPFILISGEIDVKTAVATMRDGACDFIFKDDLSRLVPAIHREREQSRIRQEKQHAEQQLRESNQKLRLTLNSLASVQEQLIASERVRALGQMASGIAHDFNNSLTKILGIAELIESGLGKEGELIQQLKVIVGDAASVVRRLSDFYRDHPMKEAVPVETGGILRDVKDFTRPRWQKRSSPVEVIVKDEAHGLALADASQLREILTNLVFNACDALEGSGTIELISRDAGERVEIEVKDNGSGMTDEVLKRCLDPLYTTKGDQGTGLGLAIATGMTESFGGSLRVSSTLGVGTSVILSFLKGEVLSEPVERRVDAATTGPESALADKRTLKVLIVDDERIIADLLTQLVMASGHQAEAFYDPTAALAVAVSGSFDVIISDRSMPQMNGDLLAAEVRKAAPATQFIMMTGFGDIMISNGEMPEGVDLIMAKPVTRKALEQSLQSIMSTPVPRKSASLTSP